MEKSQNGSKRRFKALDVIIAVVFLGILFAFMFLNIITPPNDISSSERRKLAQFPNLTMDSLLNTEFMDEFEDYVLDQFVARDELRSLKSFVLFNLFNQKDNHNIYIVDGVVSRFETMREESFLSAVRKFEKLKDDYLSGTNVYFSLVPDKNYYLAEQNGYPAFDYEFIRDTVAGLDGITHIDLFDSLSIEDYYRTDLHWDQSRLEPVVKALGSEMGFSVDWSQLTANSLSPFYGAFYGQSALNLRPDSITYMTSAAIDSAQVLRLDEKTLEFVSANMYNTNAINGIDAYDLFLEGAVPLITISNPDAARNRELIVFRDSFGSSLAPLLTSAYSKITLIDLRYFASPLLDEYVDFTPDSDVLFLYSPQILNKSDTLLVV
ncbi:MAG: DHHW family protein [Candidatus Gastranaerophilaceae bacterium]|nr:DHHW family protein [Christensenellales bacterium]